MGANEATRIQRVEPVIVNGESYYRLEDVCEALRCDKRRASRMIPGEHKRRHYEFHRGYRSRIVSIIDRHAVERLAIKFGSSPRAEIVASLR